eukprot:359074-Chlamydomonas_euryale.AAC.5
MTSRSSIAVFRGLAECGCAGVVEHDDIPHVPPHMYQLVAHMSVLVGHPDYEVTAGTAMFKGKNLFELEPEERSHDVQIVNLLHFQSSGPVGAQHGQCQDNMGTGSCMYTRSDSIQYHHGKVILVDET